MASRATRSLLSLRRFLSSSSSTAVTRSPSVPSFPRATPLARDFGTSCGVGEETANKVKGQVYSLASFNCRFAYQHSEAHRMVQATQSFYRSFASTPATEPPGQKQTEGKKEISTVEDPFDSPTYHIPEKPVTFTEGASYGIVILAGLGIAAAAAYGVFKELIFEPKEYKIFSEALERIQNDSQVRVRIGSPVKGYGQESRNRAARQRIPHRVWTDEDGVEHIEVNFYIRGPQGGGKVYCEMFKDKADNQWKYMYLIVDILQPSPTQLILESFLPA